MARRLRIQYSDAIYHVMTRGNGRQDSVQDDADRGRLVACLERAVRRSEWSLYAFVFLTNHLHLVLKTPRPNLAKGMQLFLSSYANGWARRHRHCGHLFQGALGPGRPGWSPTQVPGKEVALPPPPPLRTARESFPSCSSSLHERPSQDAAAFVSRSCTWICR